MSPKFATPVKLNTNSFKLDLCKVKSWNIFIELFVIDFTTNSVEIHIKLINRAALIIKPNETNVNNKTFNLKF